MGIQAMYEDLKDHLMTAGGRDPRTRDLPIVTSYTTVMAIIIVYILIVKKIGPAFMADRKPYNIKGIIMAYNLIQVVYNLVLFIMGTRAYVLFNPSYRWSCMPIDMTDTNDYTVELKWLCYLYFLNKIADCLDTIFFVMRKKFSHVSGLHVYHHATMIWASFIHYNVLFDSLFTAIGYWNTAVHVLMYSYYLLASLKLDINLDAWKRRMTQIQLVQFGYFFIKMAVAKMNNWCGLTNFWLNVMMFENFMMIGLFSNFYYKNYIAKKPKESVKAK